MLRANWHYYFNDHNMFRRPCTWDGWRSEMRRCRQYFYFSKTNNKITEQTLKSIFSLCKVEYKILEGIFSGSRRVYRRNKFCDWKLFWLQRFLLINLAYKRTKKLTKNTYEILKVEFPCFNHLRIELRKAAKVALVYATLHNFISHKVTFDSSIFNFSSFNYFCWSLYSHCPLFLVENI